MTKLFSMIAGVILVLAGLIVFPMPIPFGAIMIVAGLVLLMSANATVVRLIRRFRQHHRRTNKAIQAVEDRLPKKWQEVLRRSDP